MGSEVKGILKSLCCSHGWSYAVLWSYHQRNSTLLTLEDAYHDEESSTLLDDMLLQVHTFGEGIIGEAALTGNHRWEFQVEHEMQTLLVVPTASRGVVQLGSTEKIPESPEAVDQIRRAFQEIKGCRDEITGTSPSHWDAEMSDLEALFTSLVPLEEPCKVECVQGLSFDELFTPHSSSLLPAPLTFDIGEISETVGDTASSNDSCIDDFGFDILNSYSLDDLHQLLAESPHQNAALFDTAFLQDQPLENCSDDHQEASMVIQGSDKDLFDVLGLNFQDSLACISDSGPSSKGLFSELGIAEFISSSSTVSNPLINNSSSSTVSNPFINSSSSSTVSNPFSSVTNQRLSEHLCLNNPTKRRKFDTSSSQSYNNPLIKSETFGKWQSGLRIDERYRWNSKCGASKKQEEGVKKKRAKAGESTKARPKDRQMIQDRIKELRGMIPNGAKCSIDALLDLTIKHMLFMQSIAKYASELKQPYEPKLINQKGASMEEEVGGERNGATWAFEVGDESVVCPIIVEDLKLPGQMQIEMICEEGGEFLEIADAIKGMGLSILKGVMERREGRMWAHFIVEAKRQVTRLQVFWSLVQLQQQDKDTKDDSSQTHSLPLSFIDSLQ